MAATGRRTDVCSSTMIPDYQTCEDSRCPYWEGQLDCEVLDDVNACPLAALHLLSLRRNQTWNRERHGLWILEDGVGVKTHLMYNQGNINGPVEYRKDGKVQKRGFWRMGRQHGRWEFFDDATGKLRAVVEYNDGEKVGEWTDPEVFG